MFEINSLGFLFLLYRFCCSRCATHANACNNSKKAHQHHCQWGLFSLPTKQHHKVAVDAAIGFRQKPLLLMQSEELAGCKNGKNNIAGGTVVVINGGSMAIVFVPIHIRMIVVEHMRHHKCNHKYNAKIDRTGKMNGQVLVGTGNWGLLPHVIEWIRCCTSMSWYGNKIIKAGTIAMMDGTIYYITESIDIIM